MVVRVNLEENMNKKRVMITVLVVVFAVFLITALLVFNKNDADLSISNTNNENEIISSENWLKVKTLEELEQLVKKSKKEMEHIDSVVYVSEQSFGDGTATYCYILDGDNNVTGLNIGHLLVSSVENADGFVMEEVSPKELSQRIDAVMEWISFELNAPIEDNYNIFSNSGQLLSVSDESSYEQIIKGNATIELRILDNDNSVWQLSVNKIDAFNVISCVFEHFMSDTEEAKLPCDVAI